MDFSEDVITQTLVFLNLRLEAQLEQRSSAFWGNGDKFNQLTACDSSGWRREEEEEEEVLVSSWMRQQDRVASCDGSGGWRRWMRMMRSRWRACTLLRSPETI